jgi:hypothetical protein
MCMSTARANFSTTKVYAGEARLDGKYVHVVAYQNNAESQVDWQPNAMVLPFPTNVPMGRDNIINTSSFKGFLQDITNASKLVMKSLGGRRGFSASLGMADALVFESGSYTVILAESVLQIPKALLQVPEDKRPDLSYRFVLGFQKLYPDQPLAICCWKGSVEAEPLLWWYEPKDKGTLFLPTMDAHDGNAPNPEANVSTDHIVSVGSNILGDTYSRKNNRVNYTDKIPSQVKQLLPDYVYGSELPHTMKNGDMFVKTSDLKMGDKFKVPTIKRGMTSNNTHTDLPMYGWHA